MTKESAVTVAVPAGPRLVARLAVPDSPSAGLVLCHPHPLYGGDMDNPVVIRAARVARESGLATLRFNFRGVGGSEGIHGAGEAEQEDVAAALRALAERLPVRRPLGLLGYSFGAWVAARVAAADPTLSGLCLVAPPVGMFDSGGLGGSPGEVLLIAGTRDIYCPVSGLTRLAERLPGAVTALVDGADHFFFGQLAPLGALVGAWVRRWSDG